MTDKNQERVQTLSGQQAINLWLKGVEAWNKWVEENPVYNVDFSRVDFSQYREKCENKTISFHGFKFPKGKVDFIKTDFGKGNTQFKDTEFGEGEVNFIGTIFGEGIVNFYNAKFGEGEVSFSDATFGEGSICFINTNFGKGKTLFMCTKFADGDVDFTSAKFGEGNVSFWRAIFGEGKYSFEKIEFKGHVGFSDIKNIDLVTHISFKGSSFEKSFDLSNNNFNCIPDLTNTSMINQISMAGLGWKLQRKGKPQKAIYKEDAERLRRLKDIAMNNNDHALALKLYADEMRAKRWQSEEKLSSRLDRIYDQICNYGQSILNPVLWFSGTVFVFSIFYRLLGNPLSETYCYTNHLSFSFANSFPLISVSSKIKAEGYLMFTENINSLLYILMGVQGIISFIFLFLIGLGLRNKFRL